MTLNAMRVVGAVIVEMPAFKVSACPHADAPAVPTEPLLSRPSAAGLPAAAGGVVVAHRAPGRRRSVPVASVCPVGVGSAGGLVPARHPNPIADLGGRS